MERALKRYLDDVLSRAALSPTDAADVRRELSDHLQALVDAQGLSGKPEGEVIAMVEKEFGKADEIGDAVGRAKRPPATTGWMRIRRLAVQAVAAVSIALLLKWKVLEAYAVPSDAMEPAVPSGARVLVYKLAAARPGDLIVLEHHGRKYVAQVVPPSSSEGMISVRRLKEPPDSSFPGMVSLGSVVGRVCLVSR